MHAELPTKAALTVVPGDVVRFRELRSDAEERYVVGQVEAVNSRRFGFSQLLVKSAQNAAWWLLPSSYLVEML